MRSVIALLDPVAHAAVITTGGQIVIAMIAALFGQNYLTNRRAKRIEEQTRKTGNGFVDRTDDRLTAVVAAVGRIEDRQIATDRRVDRLAEQFTDHTKTKET